MILNCRSLSNAKFTCSPQLAGFLSDQEQDLHSASHSKMTFSSSPISHPTASINSLPLELVYLIFCCGRNALLSYSSRSSPLRVVCRDWQNYSPELLWEKFQLLGDVPAQKFLMSQGTQRYNTRRMWIMGL